MNRTFKIVAYSGWCMAFAFLVILVRVHTSHSTDWGEDAGRAEQLIQLSNDSSIRIQEGPSDPDTQWRVLYLPQARGQSAAISTRPWEHAGEWINEGGDVLACPLGNVIVVALARGEWVFIRTSAGTWINFNLEIVKQYPFLPSRSSLGNAALGIREIQDLRKRMAVADTEEGIKPQLAQFLPHNRELWADYLTWGKRRFRLRLKLSDSGEDFRLVGIEDFSDRQNPAASVPTDRFAPDTPKDPSCERIEFFHRPE